MDFRQIEYFRTVVAHGSLSGAAKHLEMTQPPLSSAIAKLEEELGVKLLKRTSKGVTPTQAGLVFLETGGRLLNERERLKQNLNLMGKGMVGELRIGAESMGINELIAQVTGKFTREFPEVRVNLFDIRPDEMLQSLEDGRLDIACVPFDPSTFTSYVKESFEWITTLRIDLKIAVPAMRAREDHPDGRGWGRWIVPQPIQVFPGIPEVVLGAVGEELGFRALYVSSPQTTIPFVAAGLGVALVTEKMAAGVQGVETIEAPEWAKPMRCTLLWRKGIELTPLMKRWLEVSSEVAERTMKLGSNSSYRY
ncbi:LysR family transcriptional regulator [Micrococcoides hystricis]|uniref:LysR family transcriptional regulator n=1 Tax=Micrococcoides hystricis TaxID=1572761 RepID=A0ABV6PCP7_9MICC